MSSDETPNAPVPRDRREAVRQKAEQVRVRQTRRRWLRRGLLGTGAVVAVGVVAVAVVWAVGSALNRPQLTPRVASGDGFAVTSLSAAVVGETPAPVDVPEPADAGAAASETREVVETPPVEIQVYVDYLSPGAREWQLANAKQLTSWVDTSAVSLSYHPVSMLTAKSNGTKYSLRAAAAAACVAQYSPETFFTFNSELLTQQPAVDSDGFSDVELADMAQASGADQPKRVRACIEEGAYLSWAKAATERAVSGISGTDGLALTGTPMVLVNGQQYVGVLGDAAEFAQFVLTTASGDLHKSPAPSVEPSPQASPSAEPSPSATP